MKNSKNEDVVAFESLVSFSIEDLPKKPAEMTRKIRELIKLASNEVRGVQISSRFDSQENLTKRTNPLSNL